MNLNIEFIRGDYYEYCFRVLADDGSVVKLNESDNIVFSVKKRYTSEDYILQKKLGEGIFWDEDKQCYVVQFENKDTKDLKTATYVFDVVIVYGGTKPETHVGEFTLLPDVTRNEVE